LETSCLSYKGSRGPFRGGTRLQANHTSMVEKTVSTLHSSSTSVGTGVLINEEVATLRPLMSQLESSATASSIAYTSNLVTAMNASDTPFDHSWVIDSGAFDHMIGI
jgi:uncharacterized lipoprotein